MEEFTHCNLCNMDFKSYKALASHLRQKHPDISIKEYYDRFYKKPGEGICPVCGKETKFIGRLNRGYSRHCSYVCHNRDPETIRQKKRTTYEHFGDENYRNVEKSRQSKLERYENEYYNNSEASSITKSLKTSAEWEQAKIKSWETRIRNNDGKWFSDDTINNAKATKLKHYGDPNYNNREQAKKTCIERYGVSNPNSLSDIVEKRVHSRNVSTLKTDNLKYAQYVGQILNIRKNGMLECKCKTCDSTFIISRQTLNNRINSGQTVCTICNPYWSVENDKATSQLEKDLMNYIKSVYSGIIVENDRTVLTGKELDIYLPEKKLAFEFDGLFWHSELYKEPDYHLKKTDECEKKGIQLVHVFEDEWVYRQDIVKSRLKSLLGICDRIYARKCEFREVSSKDASTFLDINHLQGAINSKYRYGLYYGGELVSLMTFGRSRFGKEFELHRFCNRLGLAVVGGASRLFHRFMKDHAEIREIMTFADRRWSDGRLYRALGFKFDQYTKPSYYYVIDGARHNRIEFQKHKLVNEGFSPDMTEHEIMLSQKIYRIYDCGNLKYLYVRD